MKFLHENNLRGLKCVSRLFRSHPHPKSSIKIGRLISGVTIYVGGEVAGIGGIVMAEAVYISMLCEGNAISLYASMSGRRRERSQPVPCQWRNSLERRNKPISVISSTIRASLSPE